MITAGGYSQKNYRLVVDQLQYNQPACRWIENRSLSAELAEFRSVYGQLKFGLKQGILGLNKKTKQSYVYFIVSDLAADFFPKTVLC